MEFNIDVQDVLKQIKFSDILEYLIESYGTTEILDSIDDDIFDKYVWTSCEDKKPFANAVVYCIYIDKSCVTGESGRCRMKKQLESFLEKS